MEILKGNIEGRLIYEYVEIIGVILAISII